MEADEHADAGNRRLLTPVSSGKMFAKLTIASAAIVISLGGAASASPGGTFEVGAGYSSDDGFLACAAVTQPDLFGSGDLLALEARISARHQLFDLHFADPRWLDVHVYDDRLALPGFTREATGGVADVSRPIGAHTRAFLGYRVEDVQVASRPRGSFGPSRYLLSTLRAGLTYDRDHAHLGITVEHADRRLGSDLDLSRVSAFARLDQPAGPFTFHLSTAFSAVSRDAPLSERLWLDGSTDVRGYSPYQLDSATTKLTTSAELETPRWHGLSLAGFVDEGVIGNRFAGSVGIGLRWHSPIGDLKLDLAFPIMGGPRLVFGI